jgi:hypothetical protein
VVGAVVVEVSELPEDVDAEPVEAAPVTPDEPAGDVETPAEDLPLVPVVDVELVPRAEPVEDCPAAVLPGNSVATSAPTTPVDTTATAASDVVWRRTRSLACSRRCLLSFLSLTRDMCQYSSLCHTVNDAYLI